MKALILAATVLSSLAVSAQSGFVNPVIFNSGNQAQIQIHNATHDDIFYLMNFNERITFTNHSIFCNKR